MFLGKYSDEPDSTPFPCVKKFISGGTSVPTSQEEKLQKVFPNLDNLTHAYGMTEIGLMAASPAPYYRRGSVGVVANGGQAKVLDIATGNPLGVNQSGEILLKFNSCFRKYRQEQVRWRLRSEAV